MRGDTLVTTSYIKKQNKNKKTKTNKKQSKTKKQNKQNKTKQNRKTKPKTKPKKGPQICYSNRSSLTKAFRRIFVLLSVFKHIVENVIRHEHIKYSQWTMLVENGC